MSVSAVLPAYNAEACIRKAIDSVLQQTASVDEIIVVDDGSSDSTCNVIASYGSRVRLIQQKNQGASAARNTGVQAATSNYVAFLDADDAWVAGKIEKQLAAFAASPTSVLCYTGVLGIGIGGNEYEDPACPLDELPAALRIGNPGLTPSCIMLSRAAFLEAGGFNVRQKVCEDWDLWLRMLALGPFCVVYEPLIRYQVNNTGLSSDFDELYDEARRMVDTRLLHGLSGLSRWAWRRRILSYQSYKSALAARHSLKRPQELRYMLLSLALWPSPLWHGRRFKALAVTLNNRLRHG